MAEPVVHFREWTTSWVRKAGKGWKLGKMAEPVVHFKEWTTGWGENAGKWPVSGGVAETPVPSPKFDKLGAPFLY